jgi:hypothetical protein
MGGTAGVGGGGGGSACPGSTDVVINEVNYDAPGNDNGYEWLELYNGSGSSVDISGWTIEAGFSSFSVRYTFPGSSSIAANGYVVVGGQNVGGADYTSSSALNMGNASGSADAVRLTDGNGGIIDTVVYGSPNSDNWLDDCGAVAASLAPSPGSGYVIARTPNGQDTNQSGDDFSETNSPTMGSAN